MSGLSYLFSIVAIILIVRWLVKVEKADGRVSLHEGIIGIKKEDVTVKSVVKRRVSWDVASSYTEEAPPQKDPEY